jgi:hypothetical protein
VIAEDRIPAAEEVSEMLQEFGFRVLRAEDEATHFWIQAE